MVLQILSIAGMALGIGLLILGLYARRMPRWQEEETIRLPDLLVAIAVILAFGSLSVLLLMP